MNRCFTNILSTDVDRAAQFYQELLGMQRHFDSDWFVILTHPERKDLELGILERDCDAVPEIIRANPAGIIVTFVVENLDTVHKQASALGAEILEEPTDMFYGQRRMLLSDPDGTTIDVSSPRS